MKDLKAILCAELDEIAMKGKVAGGDLQTIHMLTDTIKNIDKICMLDEGYANDDGYARAVGGYARGGYSRDDGVAMMSEKIGDMLDSGRYSAEERQALTRAMRIMTGK